MLREIQNLSKPGNKNWISDFMLYWQITLLLCGFTYFIKNFIWVVPFVYWDLALLDLKITLSYKTRTIKDDEFLENIPGPLSMTQLKLLQLWLYLIHHSCVTDEAKGLKEVEKNCLKSHDQIAAKWKVEPTVNPVSSHQITLS